MDKLRIEDNESLNKKQMVMTVRKKKNKGDFVELQKSSPMRNQTENRFCVKT